MRRRVVVAIVAVGAAGALGWFALGGGRGRPAAPAGALARLDAAVAPESGDQAADEQAVREALRLADTQVRTDLEVLDAARLLNKALLARPERARVVAAEIGTLRRRELAFRVALLLGRYLTDPVVHDTLLQQLRSGDNHAREVAAFSFYGWRGEPAVARALAHNFSDAQASVPIRAAAAWALARCIHDLPPEEREAVRARARALIADRAADADLRAEAVGLLEPAGADRERLWRVLASEPERSVALAAARVLLVRGAESEARVLAALGRFAAPEGGDMAARALATLLAERGRAGALPRGVSSTPGPLEGR